MPHNTVVLIHWEDWSHSSAWTEVLLLTKRGNGTFTLKAQTWGEAGTEYRYCSRPFRSGERFLLALDKAHFEFCQEAFPPEQIGTVQEAVCSLDKSLAKRVADAIASRRRAPEGATPAE